MRLAKWGLSLAEVVIKGLHVHRLIQQLAQSASAASGRENIRSSAGTGTEQQYGGAVRRLEAEGLTGS